MIVHSCNSLGLNRARNHYNLHIRSNFKVWRRLTILLWSTTSQRVLNLEAVCQLKALKQEKEERIEVWENQFAVLSQGLMFWGQQRIKLRFRRVQSLLRRKKPMKKSLNSMLNVLLCQFRWEKMRVATSNWVLNNVKLNHKCNLWFHVQRPNQVFHPIKQVKVSNTRLTLT